MVVRVDPASGVDAGLVEESADRRVGVAFRRPGNAVAANGTLGLLGRLLPLLRTACPRARCLVRLDGNVL